MMRLLSISSLAFCIGTLSACTQSSEAPKAPETATPPPVSEITAPLTLDAAINSDLRSDAEKARDGARNPKETLEFFGVEADDYVIEIWPGGGWYTNILAPFLKTDGTYIAAGFDTEGSQFAQKAMARFNESFVSKPDIYGDITVSTLSVASGPLADDNSVDVVLTFRNVHNWMTRGFTEKAFADMYAALKPGGILGVVEHRLPSAMEQDPKAASGYVHEDYVKQVAASVGFEFIASSEINANLTDTANHPFGVWTLPPTSRDQDREGNTPEGFDADRYLAIGESDRMTLKFKKPLPEVAEPQSEESSD